MQEAQRVDRLLEHQPVRSSQESSKDPASAKVHICTRPLDEERRLQVSFAEQRSRLKAIGSFQYLLYSEGMQAKRMMQVALIDQPSGERIEFGPKARLLVSGVTPGKDDVEHGMFFRIKEGFTVRFRIC